MGRHQNGRRPAGTTRLYAMASTSPASSAMDARGPLQGRRRARSL